MALRRSLLSPLSPSLPQPPTLTPARARTADADVVNSDTYDADLKVLLFIFFTRDSCRRRGNTTETMTIKKEKKKKDTRKQTNFV